MLVKLTPDRIICRIESVIGSHVKLFAFGVAVVAGLDITLAPYPQALVGLLLRQLLLSDVVRNDHVA
jgi:hypothetical protein